MPEKQPARLGRHQGMPGIILAFRLF